MPMNATIVMMATIAVIAFFMQLEILSNLSSPNLSPLISRVAPFWISLSMQAIDLEGTDLVSACG